MNPALWLLLILKFKGWARYFVRSLGTVKGAFLALVAGVMLGGWVFSMVLALPLKSSGTVASPDDVRAVGPALLLAYCLLNVVFATGERGIYFSPAEINFLFPGPFTRREILAYKIMTTVLMSLPMTLFLTFMVQIHGASFLSVYVSLFLMVLFVSLLQLALNLAAITIGASLYTRLRKLVLAIVLLALGGMAWAGGFLQPEEWQSGQMLERLKDSTAWSVATWPLRSFFEAFLATNPWPDLAFWSGLSALIDLALLGLVFWLDANYLETTATASARTYARIQKLRSGNVWAGDEGGGKVRLHLPLLPYWGGIGPILWRQLTVALRGMSRLLIMVVLFGMFMGAPLLGVMREQPGGAGVLLLAAFFTLFLTVMLSSLLPFDFRGDIDRMAVLKSLPIAAWRLTIGQLLTPTLVVTGLQWLALGMILVAGLVGMGISDPDEKRTVVGSVLVGAVFVLPFNFLLFGLENLLFLLFPSRVMGNQPGDFQAMGRNILFAFAKLISLAVVVGMAAVAALVVSWVTQNPLRGLAVAWVILTVSAALTVPLVALAFDRFDVARDTPP